MRRLRTRRARKPRLLQQISVIRARRHLNKNHQTHHVQLSRASRLWRRQGFNCSAGGRQPARSQVHHAVNRGPDIKHHCVAFLSRSLSTGGDLLRGFVQAADQCQQIRVVIAASRCATGRSLVRPSAQSSSRFPSAPVRVSVRAVETREGEICDDLYSTSPTASAARAASSATARCCPSLSSSIKL